MSVAGLLDAMRSDYPLAVRVVWQCLENHANGSRTWRMTNEQIAAELHLGINTVSRALGTLEGDKIIKVVRHRRRCSDFFMLRVYPEKIPTNAPAPVNEQPAEPELTPQIEVPMTVTESELTPQNEVPTVDLTPQFGLEMPDLTPQKGLPESNRKKEPTVSPPVARRRGRPRTGEREQLFQMFYEKYPRKRAPDAARRALFARLDAGVAIDEILAGLQRHVFPTQEKFIPYPASWLNKGQWQDETFDRNAATLRAAGLGPDGRSQPKPTGYEGLLGWTEWRQ